MLSEGMNSKLPGILDRAMSEEYRKAFLEYRKEKRRIKDEEYEELASYIDSDKCVEDIRRLKRGDFFFSAPHHFRIPKNFSGRKRDIYVWYGSEKYLFSLISYVMRDHDSIYSPCLYSFRTTLSAKDFLKKLRNFPDTEKYYIVKADVSNYVSSIVPELILPRLKKIWADDPEFYAVLEKVLLRRECIERDGSVVSCEPGGMGGLPLSNHFMNVYLMELDEYFGERSPLYCRYSDDLMIFARSLEEAQEYQSYFLDVLREKRLSTNPEKTVVIEPGGQVDILGCSLKNGVMDISEHSKNKLKRKIRIRALRLLKDKKNSGLSDREAAEKMAVFCMHTFFGWDNSKRISWSRWLFPVITTTDSLRELDHYVQDAIRYVYWGTFREKRYRTSYKDLKDMGYKSLVHAYYHFTYKEKRLEH